jgi:hypothetical protein
LEGATGCGDVAGRFGGGAKERRALRPAHLEGGGYHNLCGFLG